MKVIDHFVSLLDLFNCFLLSGIEVEGVDLAFGEDPGHEVVIDGGVGAKLKTNLKEAFLRG